MKKHFLFPIVGILFSFSICFKSQSPAKRSFACSILLSNVEALTNDEHGSVIYPECPVWLVTYARIDGIMQLSECKEGGTHRCLEYEAKCIHEK